MKKLVMFLSFALIMGVVTANAQAPKKEVKKAAPAKTEAPAPAAKKEVKKAAVKKAAPAAKKEAAKKEVKK